MSPSNLTKREMQVARGVADGLLDKEIANNLALSHGAVKYHVGMIYARLGFKGAGSRYKLIGWCFREGIAK